MKKRYSAKAGFDEFMSALSSGELSPVLIFTGVQSYLMEKAVEELKNSPLGPGGDMNFITFHGDSASGKEVADTASTYPMFSKMKLVVLKNAEKLPARELPPIETYMESPSPSTHLVLIFADGKKPKLGGKKNISRYDFTVEKGNAVSAAVEEARKLGYDLTRAGAETLISLVGEDLKEIHNELQKLSLYKGENKRIGPQEIESMTVKNQFADVYQLINAISRKDKKNAHRVLTELESAGEEPLSILGIINWRFRLLWRAKELIDKKTPRAEILKILKVSPGQFYYLSEDLKKFSYDDIIRIMDALSHCDKRLKLSYVPKNFILTKLVLELCSRN